MTGRGLISLPAHEAPLPVVHAADDTSVVLPPPDSATNVVTPAVYAKSGISISRFGRFRISDHGYDSSSSSSSSGGWSVITQDFLSLCAEPSIDARVRPQADDIGRRVHWLRLKHSGISRPSPWPLPLHRCSSSVFSDRIGTSACCVSKGLR